MEVTFVLTPDDFWRSTLYYRRHKADARTPVKRAWLALFVFLSLVCGLVIVSSWLRHHNPAWPAWPPLAALLFLAGRLFPSKRSVTASVSKTAGVFGPYRVVIGPAWFFQETTAYQTQTAWADIESVEEDADNGYLFISSYEVFIIPKRAFRAPAEARAFLDTCRHYREVARAGPNLSDSPLVWPPRRVEGEER